MCWHFKTSENVPSPFFPRIRYSEKACVLLAWSDPRALTQSSNICAYKQIKLKSGHYFLSAVSEKTLIHISQNCA